MHVAFNCIYFGEKAGGAKHLYNLLQQIQQIDGDNTYSIFVNSNMKDFLSISKENFNVIYAGQLCERPSTAILWRQFFLPMKLKAIKANLYVDFFNPFIFIKSVKSIAVIRDLGECYIPNKYDKLRMFYRTKMMLPLTVKFADRIVAISQSTRDDILDNFKTAPEKITTIYHGKDESFTKHDPEKALEYLKNRYDIKSEPYILHVGRLDAVGKNIIRLIRTYAVLKKDKGIKHKLLLVGAAWRNSVQVYDAIVRHGLEKDVVVTGYVDREDLPYFYSIADAMVFPSLYEGFGHPLIEAMMCQCPVVCSRVSSLPEIAGDAALFFDPYNVTEMAEKINEVLINKPLKKQLIERGLENVKRFSWQRNAKEYLSLFEEVASV